MMRPNIPTMVILQKKPEVKNGQPEEPENSVREFSQTQPVLVEGQWWKRLFHRLANKIRQH